VSLQATKPDVIKRDISEPYSRMARVDGFENARTLLIHIEPHAAKLDKSLRKPIAGIDAGREDSGIPPGFR
jgi:hypothetical protein